MIEKPNHFANVILYDIKNFLPDLAKKICREFTFQYKNAEKSRLKRHRL